MVGPERYRWVWPHDDVNLLLISWNTRSDGWARTFSPTGLQIGLSLYSIWRLWTLISIPCPPQALWYLVATRFHGPIFRHLVGILSTIQALSCSICTLNSCMHEWLYVMNEQGNQLFVWSIYLSIISHIT